LGPSHDHGSGKLNHKVRQASRFVQMLQHVAQAGGSTPASSARGARAIPSGPCRAYRRAFTIAGKEIAYRSR
jgi:hypothetical protein